jgi:hypothetical protein
MKDAEYQEGPKAKEDFERTMTALFNAPKSTPKAPKKPKRKPKNAHRD